MRLVLALTAIVTLVTPILHADAWEKVITKAQSAVVYIQVGDDGGCSGFVINKAEKFVMTAAHCYGEKLWVDHVKADVVALDDKKDLMVLKVPYLDPSRDALVLAAKNPDIRQDVLSVGFGYALDRPFFKTAHVSDTDVRINAGASYIGVDASFTPGQSGGPVLDQAGEVVAIVQLGDGGTLGLGVGAETIRARLGRFFGK